MAKRHGGVNREAEMRARAAAAKERQQAEQAAAVERRQEKQQQRAQPVRTMDPLAQLGLIVDRRVELDRVELGLVEQLRAVGVPWSVIGRGLGITGQAASMRFRRQGVE